MSLEALLRDKWGKETGRTRQSLVKGETGRSTAPEEEVACWMVQVADALTYLHNEMGIVHRDLKPDNVLLNGQNRIKVADFGLSFYVDGPVERYLCGTDGFQAPEMTKETAYGRPIDIYAFSAMFHCMLLGDTPDPVAGSLCHDNPDHRPEASDLLRMTIFSNPTVAPRAPLVGTRGSKRLVPPTEEEGQDTSDKRGGTASDPQSTTDLPIRAKKKPNVQLSTASPSTVPSPPPDASDKALTNSDTHTDASSSTPTNTSDKVNHLASRFLIASTSIASIPTQGLLAFTPSPQAHPLQAPPLQAMPSQAHLSSGLLAPEQLLHAPTSTPSVYTLSRSLSRSFSALTVSPCTESSPVAGQDTVDTTLSPSPPHPSITQSTQVTTHQESSAEEA
ncbi:hypothetical protein BGX29_007685 [Mortierella sp. GBA35]|nr:hypothetical protein BGX29_007685 [Mortierella sp. GBA35]